MNTASRSKLLATASLALLIATGYIGAMYGQSAYFVAFHKPFHLSLTSRSVKYSPPVLPKFQVQTTISSHSLTHGDTQHIALTALPDKTVAGHVEIWIESPGHKQVFRSMTDGSPTRFIKNKLQTFSYSYVLPKNLPPGAYKVSAIITSTNKQTDYYVNNNFATFTVS